MAEIVSPYLKFDIQRKQYYEGEEDYLRKQLETEDEKYRFQFDRLYTYHEGAIRTYRFRAKLKDEVAEAERAVNPDIELITVSEAKIPAFEWEDLDDEIIHIDTTVEDYGKMMETLWINFLELNDDEDIVKNENERNVKHWNAFEIEDFQFPEDWTGKDKIYFITDGGIEVTNTMLDNYGSLYDEEEPDRYNNYINDTILTIKEAIEKVGAGTASEAGVDVKNYGFS